MPDDPGVPVFKSRNIHLHQKLKVKRKCTKFSKGASRDASRRKDLLFWALAIE